MKMTGEKILRKRIILGTFAVVLLLLVTYQTVPSNGASFVYVDSWIEMSPAIAPPGRGDSALVYDSGSDVVILFGGILGIGRGKLNDTWAYSYESNTWTNKSPSIAPDERGAHGLAYDSESDRVILFSGFIRIDDVTGHVCYNETWEYDYVSNTWTNLQPATVPTPRVYASMAYDEDSDRIILFGGILEGTSVASDTWSFDYDTNTWENMNPLFGPSGRFAAAMTYNSDTDQIILSGGTRDGRTGLTDTWAYDYDHNLWTNLNPSVPPTQSPMYMTYDAEEGTCVFFSEDEDCNETNIYNCTSNSWSSSTPSIHPTARTRAPLVYDSNSEMTILFGGVIGRYDNLLTDTWAYNSTLEEVPDSVNGPILDPFILAAILGGVGIVIAVIVVFIRKK
jgi:hypothetical protein